jgi:murein L,D-transpeptidase YafK
MASGGLGPKVREGDLQVPEGVYQIDAFNPASRFHLALRVGYPNAVDRARARALGVPAGGDIMVHGGCATVGCLPLRDGPMERLYVAAVQARASSRAAIPVHLHPCRYETPSCRAALDAEGPTWEAHWAALEAIDAAFRRSATAPPGN